MLDWLSLVVGAFLGAILGAISSVAITWYFWKKPPSISSRSVGKTRIDLQLKCEQRQNSRNEDNVNEDLTGAYFQLERYVTSKKIDGLKVKLVEWPKYFKPAPGVKGRFSLDWDKNYDHLGYFDLRRMTAAKWSRLDDSFDFKIELQRGGSRFTNEERTFTVTKSQVFNSVALGKTSIAFEEKLKAATGQGLNITRYGQQE